MFSGGVALISNEKLVLYIQAGKNRRVDLEELYQQNKGLIVRIAQHYLWGGEMDDLMQEGFIGLMVAADRWDPEGGASFAPYAAEWIRQRMQRYCESMSGSIRLPSYKIQQIQHYRKYTREYESSYGTAPTVNEICETLKISPDELKQLKTDAAMQNIQSLNAPIGHDDDRTTIYDTVPAETDEAEEIIENRYREELDAFLWDMVDSLPDKQQAQVIRWRFQEGLSYAECDARMGAKPGQAKRYEAAGLSVLKRPGRISKIADFTDSNDWIYSAGLKSTGAGVFQRTATSATEWAALFALTHTKSGPPCGQSSGAFGALKEEKERDYDTNEGYQRKMLRV